MLRWLRLGRTFASCSRAGLWRQCLNSVADCVGTPCAGDVTPKPQGRPAGQFRKLAPHMDYLGEIVRAEPDITLAELGNALEDTFGLQVQLSSIHRALQGAGFSYKKGLIAKERDRPALRRERAAWINRRQPRIRLEPHRLVFIERQW